ncbi:MAG: hypothetical protein V1833_01945 [Elusimicrobiota bacterium]
MFRDFCLEFLLLPALGKVAEILGLTPAIGKLNVLGSTVITHNPVIRILVGFGCASIPVIASGLIAESIITIAGRKIADNKLLIIHVIGQIVGIDSTIMKIANII